jgi:hypothetical protein
MPMPLIAPPATEFFLCATFRPWRTSPWRARNDGSGRPSFRPCGCRTCAQNAQTLALQLDALIDGGFERRCCGVGEGLSSGFLADGLADDVGVG